MEIYDNSNTVQAAVLGTVDDASNGIYTIKPDSNDLDGLENGETYYYRIKTISPTYPQGRVYYQNTDGLLYTCIIGVS